MKTLKLLLLLTLCSCSNSIKDFHSYKKHFLNRSAFMPTKEELKRKSPKVVIFAFDEGKNQTAIKANLGKSLANNLENILSKNRLAKLIDRGAAKKLKSEVSLAELKGQEPYKGPALADYIISGDIGDASFSSKYSSGSTYVNPKNFAIISIPPSYKYSSQVSGNIKIYELPNLNIINTISFKGKKTRRENARQKGGISVGGMQIGGEKLDGIKRDDGLVRRAGKVALNNVEYEIKSAFAKRGYILEKRVNESGDAIFKINVGSVDGIKTGDKIEISSKEESINPITEESEIESSIIAKAKVSNKVNSRHSWIILEDEDKANLIKLGDIAKVKYKKNKLILFLTNLFN